MDSLLGRNSPCPYLPKIDRIYGPTITRRHGMNRGAAFFLDALRYAQSQWMSGKPAQALLQLDKAWMAEWGDDGIELEGHLDSYRALVWIMVEASTVDSGYMGNPVRHFQHLASRMSGARSETRSWRAWLCLHLAERHLPMVAYPRDGLQIVREGLWIPGREAALSAIGKLGWEGEAELVRDLLAI